MEREWSGSGTIRLLRFWAGRARRLLPALFLLIAVIGIVLAVVPTVLTTPNILGDALSTMFYVSNWYSMHGGVTYFSSSTQPSPLLHTWSLAIEEQFYLVWPVVVLGVLKLGATRRSRRPGRRVEHRAVDVLGGGQLLLVGPSPVHDDPAWTPRRRLHVLFVVACLGSLTSAVLMAFLAPDGYTTRAYYGTDTRAQALLVGAAIAIGLTLWRDGSGRRWFTRLASVLALAGVAGTAALWATTSQTMTFAFSGGFMVASLAAGAVVLGCAVAPRSLVVRLLELPPLPPALPAATSTKPVKVLLVGDSVAGTLGVGLAQEARQYNVQIANEGTPGCSLAMQEQIRVLFYTVAPNPPCGVDADPNSLLGTWREWVDAYNPDVVVDLARGETFDQEVGGQWQNIGHPGFDGYLANRYRQAIGVLGSKGASVVLATSPFYDSGTSPAGTPWPEDGPSRVTLDNATMRAVAATTPKGADGSRVYVFDLNAMVSPDHAFSPTVDQINVRCTDGVHFTRSGGIYVAQRLAPELAALGQEHAAASPGGEWPGPLPPSTPSWFTNLPCQ